MCASVKFLRSVNEWLMDSSVLRKLWPWFQHDIPGCMGCILNLHVTESELASRPDSTHCDDRGSLCLLHANDLRCCS